MNTIAGGGSANGDGGLATAADLPGIAGVAVDPNGNVYLTDIRYHRVRKVTASTGILSTIVGRGVCCGYNGDGIAATSAVLNFPMGLAADAAGNIFIADSANHRLRRVDAASGIITTAAGTGAPGFSGDNGPASAAQLASPYGVAVDAAGNLFIADAANHRIRRIDAVTRVITTIAGTGNPADLNLPTGVAVDPDGNLYITDTANSRILKRSAATGLFTTVAGTGQPGFNADVGLATAVQLSNPFAITADADGNFYIADKANNRIRKVTAATGIMTTIAGAGDSAEVLHPSGVALDGMGNLFMGDTDHDRVGFVDFLTPPPPQVTPTLAAASPSQANAPLSQTFTLTARDGNGYADINRIYFLLAPGTAITTNSCHGFYDRLTNTTYLYNDDLTALATSPNSQCAVSATAASTSSTDLQFTITLTRRGRYATGSRFLSAWIVDATGAGTGWVTTSHWYALLDQPPALVSATPATATSAVQAFTITATDPLGAANINRIYFLLSPTPVTSGYSCHGFYDRASNATYLYDNDLKGFGTNTQCAVQSSAATVGPNLQLNLTLTRKGTYLSDYRVLNLYVWVTNNGNLGTGWLPVSVWDEGTRQPPIFRSSMPSTSTSTAQTFTITAGDSGGVNNLDRIYFLVNTTSAVPTNSCHGFSVPATNTTYLYNDALTGFGANSQCTVTASAVQASSTYLYFNLTITRQGAYTLGTKNVYIWITNKDNLGTGWIPIATWTPGGQQAPTLVTATPLTPTATSQTFTLTARDANGATDLSRIYFLLNPTPSIPVNSCHGYYDLATNTTQLYNNALTGFDTNNQCAVTATALQVSATDMELRLTITRLGAYTAGTLSLYVWLTDQPNSGTGWIPVANWTIPGPGSSVNTRKHYSQVTSGLLP